MPSGMRKEEFFRVRHGVVLIESAGPGDAAAGRSEAEALSAVLRLAGVPVVTFSVSTGAELKSALAEGAKWAAQRIDGCPMIATIHLSAHGNADGIGLTSGDFVAWRELRRLLLKFAHATGRISPRGLSLVDLSMSSCKGAFAARMFDVGAPYPCTGIVGPNADVIWSDALVMFVSLYHLTDAKELRTPDALPIAQRAAGVESFELHLPPDIAERFSPRGLELAREFERNHWSPTNAPSSDAGS